MRCVRKLTFITLLQDVRRLHPCKFVNAVHLKVRYFVAFPVQIRVVVEKESSGKLRGQRKRSEKVSKEKFQRIDEVIRWQSKKFSPAEFARYSSADSANVKLVKRIKTLVEHPDDDHASDSDDGDNSASTPSENANESTSVRHEHYIKLQNTKLKSLRQELRNREVEPKSVFRPVSLFTYIDRDGYVPRTRPLVDNKHVRQFEQIIF